MLQRKPEPQGLILGHRVSPREPARQSLGREIRSRRGELLDVLIGERDRAAKLVHGAIGIREIDVVDLVVFAAPQVERDTVAGAHEVGMHEVTAEDDSLRLREADTAAELPGQTFLDCEVDVD